MAQTDPDVGAAESPPSMREQLAECIRRIRVLEDEIDWYRTRFPEIAAERAFRRWT